MKMEQLRLAAMNEGRKTYFTGKACRRGHMSDRYASCGLCVACVTENGAKLKEAARQQKRIANAKKFDKASVYSTIVRAYQRPAIDSLVRVFSYGTQSQIETVMEFIGMVAGQVILPTVARNPGELDKPALAARVCLDPGNLCNADGSPLVERYDEHRRLYIEIDGHCYAAMDLAACWKGERASVLPHMGDLS